MSDLRIGHGYDVHRLVKGRKLILGGVEITHDKGLDGHSDADVLLHAISDALLGAASLGDIGQHFPPDDDTFKDADSTILLAKVAEMVRNAGYPAIINIDAIIMAEQPKMAQHIPAMRQRIAEILGIDLAQVGLKATTTERLGMVGREEGIAASAVCLIKRDD